MPNEKLTRIAINFDLDTKKLQQNYLKTNWRNAYNELRIEFEKCDFEHQQGSGYASNDVLSTKNALRQLKKICKTLPWLANSISKITLTHIGDTYQVDDTLRLILSPEARKLATVYKDNEKTSPAKTKQEELGREKKR